MKPMLAATLESLDDVTFPCYLSPKLDGIRCLMHGGMAVSRNLKPIPNKHIQHSLKGLADGLDGELMVGGDFNAVQSAVMSENGEPEFVYCIFDKVAKEIFETRHRDLKQDLAANKQPIMLVEAVVATERKQVIAYEIEMLKRGYEGIIIRSPDSPYKFGRSTLKEGFLLKYKRFKDAEAIIIGFEELNHNDNPKTKDALGHSQRSSHKIGMRPAGMLGNLIMFDEERNVEFEIGSGFTQEEREEIWKNQKKYMGKTVTYKFQEYLASGKPRFPTFKGFRLEG